MVFLTQAMDASSKAPGNALMPGFNAVQERVIELAKEPQCPSSADRFPSPNPLVSQRHKTLTLVNASKLIAAKLLNKAEFSIGTFAHARTEAHRV
jgi:hypothetical protein